MGSAAQFLTHFGYRNHPDLLLIFLAEKGERALGNRLVDFHDLRLYGHVSEDDSIDLLLNFLDFPVGQGREMRVIEAEPVRRDKRSCLLNVCSQRFAQDRMEYVRSGMIRSNPLAAFFIGSDLDLIVYGDFAEFHLHFMDDDAANRRISVDDTRNSGWGCQRACITHLAAGFSVKGG